MMFNKEIFTFTTECDNIFQSDCIFLIAFEIDSLSFYQF